MAAYFGNLIVGAQTTKSREYWKYDIISLSGISKKEATT